MQFPSLKFDQHLLEFRNVFYISQCIQEMLKKRQELGLAQMSGVVRTTNRPKSELDKTYALAVLPDVREGLLTMRRIPFCSRGRELSR